MLFCGIHLKVWSASPFISFSFAWKELNKHFAFFENNKIDKEIENVDQNQHIFFPLVIVNKYKKQWSRSKAEKISGDQISKNANLNDSEKQVKK